MIQGSKFWNLTQGDFTPSSNKPVYFTGTIGNNGYNYESFDWSVWAPGGFGLQTDDTYGDFDGWTTDNFPAVTGVNRLVLSTTTGGANAHVHSDLPYSDLAIDLYDNSTGTWVTVWSYRLENPFYPGGTSYNFHFDVDVTFPAISEVTAIRLTSDPYSNDTYHDWNLTGSPVIFELHYGSAITGVNSETVYDIANLISGGKQVGVFGIMVPAGTTVASATPTTGTLVLSPYNNVNNEKPYGSLYYYDTSRPCAAAGDGSIQAVVCLDDAHADFAFIDASGKEVLIPAGTMVKGFTYYFNIGKITTITDGQFIGYSAS